MKRFLGIPFFRCDCLFYERWDYILYEIWIHIIWQNEFILFISKYET
jgi:hypothetical protein